MHTDLVSCIPWWIIIIFIRMLNRAANLYAMIINNIGRCMVILEDAVQGLGYVVGEPFLTLQQILAPLSSDFSTLEVCCRVGWGNLRQGLSVPWCVVWVLNLQGMPLYLRQQLDGTPSVAAALLMSLMSNITCISSRCFVKQQTFQVISRPMFRLWMYLRDMVAICCYEHVWTMQTMNFPEVYRTLIVVNPIEVLITALDPVRKAFRTFLWRVALSRAAWTWVYPSSIPQSNSAYGPPNT